MVELGKTPVDKSQLRKSVSNTSDNKEKCCLSRQTHAYLPVLMIDHNVMRLHISMHDALAVAVVEGLEEFEDVVPHVEVVELRIERPEIGVVDVFEDEGRCFALHMSSQSLASMGS